MTLVVPTIDVSQWETGDDSVRSAIAKQVDEACRSIGFMQITGHGIPDDVVAGFTDALDEMFSLPDDIKRQYRPSRPSINRGYAPPRSERLSYSLGVDSPADMFEAFNIGVEVAPRAGDAPDMHSDNIWPEPAVLPDFEAKAKRWLDSAGGLARRMTSIFAHALGVEADFFESFTERSIDVLRMVNYAIQEGTQLEVGQLGMGAHTDFGIVGREPAGLGNPRPEAVHALFAGRNG